jgi:hypothetical protein
MSVVLQTLNPVDGGEGDSPSLRSGGAQAKPGGGYRGRI